MSFNFRFFISWIMSAVVMFVLFYVWHGYFLNDFKRINFPLIWFVTFAAFTYLIFGAGIFFLFESQPLKKVRSSLARGLLCGVLAGFSLFMISTIVNISLTRHLSVNHLMVDCIWQMAEQTVGAMVIVLFKVIIHEPIHESI
ncbi:MAG: hypothetical protein ABIP51_23825 [Bacteroidia bacterium]